jgi:hypothetical protein
MTTDNGGAPCVTRSLLSLAICKPRIRTQATKGSLIFGFGANEEPMERRLIYIAEITELPLKSGDYYRKFRDRPDCIYEWRETGSLMWRRGSRFHKNGSERKSDIGLPPNYPKATVLLSRNFRYFGRAGTTDYAEEFPLINATIRKLGRWYEVHHTRKLRAELLRLKRRLWRTHHAMKIGNPTSDNVNTRCNKASAVVKIC